MDNRIVFGRWETVTLLINLICTKIFLNFPRVVAELAGTASWLLVVYISALIFVTFFIIAKLYRRFEGKDLLDIGEYAAGTAGRVFTGIVVLIFLIFSIFITLREFVEDMKVISLPASPISFVLLFFISCMAIGAYFGIEAILRFHAIAVPCIAVGFIFILIMVLPSCDFTNLLPILGNGISDVTFKSSRTVAAFSELLLLFLIVPFIKTNKNLKKAGYTALGISALFFASSALLYIASTGYPTGKEVFLPIYQMSRLINFGRFFQRVEPLFLIIWSLAALLYLSTVFFFILYVFKKTFRLEYQKPLIIPFAVLIFTLSLVPQNLVAAIKLERSFFRGYSWIITFVFPILLLIIARLLRKGVKKEVKE